MKLKDGYTSSALKRCEVFQTENKKQSKTPLYFLFLIYIIWVYSLNYIRQTQKNRLLTLGETNIIFHWYFELCFTEIMIPESLFTVFQFQPQRFIFRQWHYSFYYLSINNYFVIRFTFTTWIVHKRMFIFMQRRNWVKSQSYLTQQGKCDIECKQWNFKKVDFAKKVFNVIDKISVFLVFHFFQ